MGPHQDRPVHTVLKLENTKTPSLGRGFRNTSKQVWLLEQAFALRAFASQFAGAANGLCFLASLLFRRLFEIGTRFHFAEQAFALHLLLQRAEGLLHIVVADGNLNNGELSIDVFVNGPVK